MLFFLVLQRRRPVRFHSDLAIRIRFTLGDHLVYIRCTARSTNKGNGDRKTQLGNNAAGTEFHDIDVLHIHVTYTAFCRLRIPVNVTDDSGNVTGIPVNVIDGRCCAI